MNRQNTGDLQSTETILYNAIMVDACHYSDSDSNSEVAQSCPTLCDPMDWGLPGSSTHGILQARILEWVAISFSTGSSQPRDRTQVSHIGSRSF